MSSGKAVWCVEPRLKFLPPERPLMRLACDAAGGLATPLRGGRFKAPFRPQRVVSSHVEHQLNCNMSLRTVAVYLVGCFRAWHHLQH